MFDQTQHYIIPILFLTGLTAGSIDAIAGGGGLISLPVLLACGLPPHIALGTNKLQASIGTSMATYTYYRRGLISFKTVSKGLVFGIAGSAAGSWVGQIVSNEVLTKIIPILLALVLLYTLTSPKLGSHDTPPKIHEFLFYMIFGFALGFYDGFFGPGTGTLWIFSLILFLGYNLTKASAYTKVFNLKSNLVATVCFAIGGNMNYPVALTMAAGQLVGGIIGANLAISRGAALIRRIFILVVVVTISSLIYRTYGA